MTNLDKEKLRHDLAEGLNYILDARDTTNRYDRAVELSGYARALKSLLKDIEEGEYDVQ